MQADQRHTSRRGPHARVLGDAIERLLRDYPELSNGEVARRLRCHPTTVAAHRKLAADALGAAIAAWALARTREARKEPTC